MRTARIQTFRNDDHDQRTVLLIEHEGGTLTDYELDHLGEIVGSYLIAIGYDGIVGPKSVRTEMTDEQLEDEFDDFSVVTKDPE